VFNRNRAFGHLLQAITALPMPVLAVVEGATMGAGLGLACCADIVLATEDAGFALSETGLGLRGERLSGTLAQSLSLVGALAADSDALDALEAQWLSRILACAPQAKRSLKARLSRGMAGNLSLTPRGSMPRSALHNACPAMPQKASPPCASGTPRAGPSRCKAPMWRGCMIWAAPSFLTFAIEPK